jgi:hypothetical protein
MALQPAMPSLASLVQSFPSQNNTSAEFVHLCIRLVVHCYASRSFETAFNDAAIGRRFSSSQSGDAGRSEQELRESFTLPSERSSNPSLPPSVRCPKRRLWQGHAATACRHALCTSGYGVKRERHAHNATLPIRTAVSSESCNINHANRYTRILQQFRSPTKQSAFAICHSVAFPQRPCPSSRCKWFRLQPESQSFFIMREQSETNARAG